MPDDSLTLRDFLIALNKGEIEQYENDVLDLLEPMVQTDFDGWGDSALHEWYRAMLMHLVQELGGPEVVLGMVGVDVAFPSSSSGTSSEN